MLGAVAILAVWGHCSQVTVSGAVASPGLQAEAAVAAVPEAPLPQFAIAGSGDPAPAQAAQSRPLQTPPPNAQQSTSPQSPQPAPGDSQKPSADEQRQKAQEQLKEQEHQRVMGVMAAFNTTRNREALPLSPKQKFQLFFKSETDPWPFGLAVVVAGIGQADDSFPEWGQGMQGYAKRFGAAYGDAFIGNFFGNAVLTSWWHEDPRYYQKGTGSKVSRLLWAATSTVWCRRDKGTWGPNYANVVGNLMGAAIARTYYPRSDRTVTDTITDGFTVSAEGIVGSEVIEFWPDLVRMQRRKHAEKLAREAAKKQAQQGAQPEK